MGLIRDKLLAAVDQKRLFGVSNRKLKKMITEASEVIDYQDFEEEVKRSQDEDRKAAYWLKSRIDEDRRR